jgi:hypothetical protein
MHATSSIRQERRSAPSSHQGVCRRTHACCLPARTSPRVWLTSRSTTNLRKRLATTGQHRTARPAVEDLTTSSPTEHRPSTDRRGRPYRQRRNDSRCAARLAVFKGAEHRLPASLRIPTRLVSAGQGRANVSPHPWRSFRGPARVFYKCSTAPAAGRNVEPTAAVNRIPAGARRGDSVPLHPGLGCRQEGQRPQAPRRRRHYRPSPGSSGHSRVPARPRRGPVAPVHLHHARCVHRAWANVVYAGKLEP